MKKEAKIEKHISILERTKKLNVPINSKLKAIQIK